MKKNIIILIIVAAALGGGYFMFQGQSSDSSETRTSEQPARPAEVNGTIISAQGNELVIANELNRPTLSDEEKEANKGSRQDLSPEERTALREEEQQEFETENVSITIPVGVPIIGGSGEATGELVKIDIAELAKGTYISAWVTPENIIEYVKVKGTN